MRKHGYGVALYPPPEVGGFTATNDKLISTYIRVLDDNTVKCQHAVDKTIITDKG